MVIVILSVALILLALISIAVGSVKYPLSSIIFALFSPEKVPSTQAYIIRNLRLPRTLTALLAGSALAFCGLIFQTVFRNPMADSYVLGISSGASAFIGVGMLTGLMSLTAPVIPFYAFLGSFVTTLFLFLTGRKNPSTLLLTGIALNFFLSAVTTLTIYLGKRQLDSILFWTMGSVSSTTWQRTAVLFFVCVFIVIFSSRSTSALDVLLTDDSTAISSGLNVKRFRIYLLLLSSAITAIVVSFCGVIGFIGLMSPHFARILCGPRHKRLIWASMILGSDILLFSDILSRFILSPSELPIGLVTSLLGAPVFFILLKRRKKL